MPTATVTVTYVNQPKSEKGPGSIKDSNGRFYKVWRTSKDPTGATLASFEVGKTYEIEYDTEEYQGKEQYTARKIVSASSTSTNGANGHHDASAAYRNGNAGAGDSIKWQCMLKVAGLIYAGAGATTPLGDIVACARSLYNEPIDIVAEAKKVFNATEAE